MLRDEMLTRILALRSDWSHTGFLWNASVAALQDWIACGQLRSFLPGETLMTEGETSDEIFMLLTGVVKVAAHLESGGTALLAVRVAGDVVGELAAADGAPRLASVQVCGRDTVEALVLPRIAFSKTVARHPEEAIRLSAVVAGKLRSATRRRVDISGSSPLVRLARVLVELGEDHGELLDTGSMIIRVNLTQVEIGTLIGVAEVTAQRALRKLRRSGLIDVSGRRPIIRDWDGLIRMASTGQQPII